MRHRGIRVLAAFSCVGVALACTSTDGDGRAAPSSAEAGAGGTEPGRTAPSSAEAGAGGTEPGSAGANGVGGTEPGRTAPSSAEAGAGGDPGPTETRDASTDGSGDAETNDAGHSDSANAGSGGDSNAGGSPADLVDAGSGGTLAVELPDSGEHSRQHLLLDEGFEGDDPFAAFSVGQACCDHTITASSEQARDGEQSFRAEVRVGDPAVSSGYRAELTMPELSDEGDRWYGFAVYFESPTDGDEWTGTNGHFVQWHPDNGSGSASLGLWSYGDGWLVGLNPEGDDSAEFESLDRPIAANRWHDVVLHVDWGAGVVQFWLNSVLEVDAVDVDFASGPGQYMKFGINRWGEGPNGEPTEDDWVIFYDSFRIGDEQATYADVAP